MHSTKCRAALTTLLSAVLLSQIHIGVSADKSTADAGSSQQEESTVCFVVRTYWGHGDDYGDRSLRTLLGSLQSQEYTRWNALLAVVDNRPFPELRRILRDLHDDRVWVHAELINHKYEPKSRDSRGHLTWKAGYHNLLYNITDAAIRACPPSTEWVIVTNGDNSYDDQFLNHILAAPPSTDAVAFNFYSRYQRPTANPCERFVAGQHLPMCKENDFRFCQTDLAANAYRWDKLIAEDRRFGDTDPGGNSHGANDGMLSQRLLVDGWQVHRVHTCLVDHAPNPQMCAMTGGVWDDGSMIGESNFGGDCLDKVAAAKLLAADRTNIEMISIDVSHDAGSFFFHELDGAALSLSCIRKRDPAQWLQAQVFGRACCAPVDRELLPDSLPPHPWDHWAGPLASASLADEL